MKEHAQRGAKKPRGLISVKGLVGVAVSSATVFHQELLATMMRRVLATSTLKLIIKSANVLES